MVKFKKRHIKQIVTIFFAALTFFLSAAPLHPTNAQIYWISEQQLIQLELALQNIMKELNLSDTQLMSMSNELKMQQLNLSNYWRQYDSNMLKTQQTESMLITDNIELKSKLKRCRAACVFSFSLLGCIAIFYAVRLGIKLKSGFIL